MFANRNQDENAIYGQQTAAAAKPLNGGIKGLAPKTPVAKMPFKTKRHDENAIVTGKAGGKGADTKAEQNNLLTPIGLQARAPLGNKTTNAKAGAFKTPAPDTVTKQSKQSSPRQRRAKVKIHQPTPLVENSEDEYPDIEYMPPREVPLLDHPDEWPHDRTYPELQGENMTRGWLVQDGPEPLDAESDAKRWKEKLARATEQERREREKSASANLSSLKAKDAASALSRMSNSTIAPRQSQVASRQATTSLYKKPVVNSKGPSHTAARVASNTTLGYSKGRAVSRNTRPPLSSVFSGPSTTRQTVPSQVGTNFDELLRMTHLEIVDSDDGQDEDEADIGGVALDIDAQLDGLLPPDFKLGPVDE